MEQHLDVCVQAFRSMPGKTNERFRFTTSATRRRLWRSSRAAILRHCRPGSVTAQRPLRSSDTATRWRMPSEPSPTGLATLSSATGGARGSARPLRRGRPSLRDRGSRRGTSARRLTHAGRSTRWKDGETSQELPAPEVAAGAAPEGRAVHAQGLGPAGRDRGRGRVGVHAQLRPCVMLEERAVSVEVVRT